MQLDALWNFMQVDMEADGFEAKMRQSANRQKLIKQRDFLKDQQANMKKLESDVAVMQDRLEAVEDEAARNMYERSELDYLLYNLARYSLSDFYQASSGFGAKKAVSRSCVSCSLWI